MIATWRWQKRLRQAFVIWAFLLALVGGGFALPEIISIRFYFYPFVYVAAAATVAALLALWSKVAPFLWILGVWAGVCVVDRVAYAVGIHPLFERHAFVIFVGVISVVVVVVACVREGIVKREYGGVSAEFAKNGRLYILRPRPDAQWGVRNAVQFWSQASRLLNSIQYIKMGVCGYEGDIAFYLITRNWQDGKLYCNQLRGDYVGLQIDEFDLTAEENPTLVPDGWEVVQIVLKERDWRIPLKSKSAAPLAALISDLAHLKTDNNIRGGISVSVRSGFDAHLRAKQLRGAALNPKAKKVKAGNKMKFIKPSVDKEAVSQLSDRAQNPMLEVHLVAWVAAESAESAHHTAVRLAQQLAAQFIGDNSLRLYTIDGKLLGDAKGDVKGSAEFPLDYKQYAGEPMTDTDLASIMHLMADTGVAIAPTLRVVEEDTPTFEDAGEITADKVQHLLQGLKT